MTEPQSNFHAINKLLGYLRWTVLMLALLVLTFLGYHLWNMHLDVTEINVTLYRPTPTATPTETPKPIITVPGTLKDFMRDHKN